MTLYDTLEVETYASQREIKRAYRRLARRYHPDYNPGDPESEERFKDVVAAYEVLSDRRKRAAYDARVRIAETPTTPRTRDGTDWTHWTHWTHWKRPERTTEEWKDLERDLSKWGKWRNWRRVPLFDFRDAQLGALLTVSLTLASNASREEVEPFLNVLAAALAAGFVCSWPFRLGFVVNWAPLRSAAAMLAPFAAAMGALAGSTFATGGPPPSLWGASGIPFAFVGGMGGALVGGMFGRSFRQASEPVLGVLVGGFTGAILGGGLGGFFWYWSSIFRYMEWPVRDDLSVLASAGVVGALLGAAVAAALGGARDPAQS